MNARQKIVLDLQRVLLLIGKSIKFGIFPYAGMLPVPIYRRLSFAVRLRRTIEELGLTYLKLGQFLALRYDVLPPEICTELNELFENVAPMPFETARGILETELGGPLEDFFSQFEQKPIAAASVAQVHRAHTMSGQLVAVKVQRAGLDPIFRADIRILQRFAALAERMGLAGRLSFRGMLAQFEQWTLREMDFRTEAHTAERVASRAQDFVVVPKVFWELTTQRILTMEFIEGVSVTEAREWLQSGDLHRLHERLPGFDLGIAMHNLAFASFHQLFTTGFFHGDPHPGNIFFMPDNKVAFLDFGIFGNLNRSERQGVAAQIENLALGDLENSFRSYCRQVAFTEDTDYQAFRRDCLEVLGRWYGALTDSRASIEDRHLAKYTSEMIDVSRRNGLRYDLNFLLFWRALNNLNGTLWRIDPNFDLVGALREFFDEIRPDDVERVRAVLRDYDWQLAGKQLAAVLPVRVSDILGGISNDGPRVAVVHARSSRSAALDSNAHRYSGYALLVLTLTIVLAAQINWILRAGVLSINLSGLVFLWFRRGRR